MHLWTKTSFTLLTLLTVASFMRCVSGVIPAIMELLITTDRHPGRASTPSQTTKFIRGVYLRQSPVYPVEGQPQQVHPRELCNAYPLSNDYRREYGAIMVIKLENRPVTSFRDECNKLTFQITRSISMGAAAVILITTDYPLIHSQLPADVEFLRPVILVDIPSEENKLFTILTHMSSAYMRVNLIPTTVSPPRHESLQSEGSEVNQGIERYLLYIIIGSCVGLAMIVLAIVMAVLFRVKHSSRHSQELVVADSRHSPEGLESAKIAMISPAASQRCSTASHSSSAARRPISTYINRCHVCQEDFITNKEYRVLPCGHMLHVECAALWLKQKKGCPSCSASIYDEVETASSRPASRHKCKRRRQNDSTNIKDQEMKRSGSIVRPLLEVHEEVEGIEAANLPAGRSIQVQQLLLTNIQT